MSPLLLGLQKIEYFVLLTFKRGTHLTFNAIRVVKRGTHLTLNAIRVLKKMS